MARPKIAILRKVVLSQEGHYRYYSTGYDQQTRSTRHKAVVLNLDPRPAWNPQGQPYTFLNIATEKQLVTFIFQNFGEGEYRVIAYLKKRKGAYTFWKGDITQEGWTFLEKNTVDQRHIMKLKKELYDAQTSGDIELADAIVEDIKFEQEEDMQDANTKKARYGFTPFLRRSGKRGEFHPWDEEDEGLQPMVFDDYMGGESAY